MTTRREAARLLWRTVAGAVRAHPRPAARLAFWSALEALPVLLFGQAVGRAVEAFAGGRPGTAAAWLAALGASALAGAAGARRLYAPLAEIVEPLRDELVRGVARGALRRSAAGRPDTGAVARLTHQVEIVRDTFGGILVVLRGFLFSVAGALVGLATLMPEIVLLVVPPLLLGLALFTAVFGAAAVRQRALVVGEEEIAERTAAIAGGLRDAVACGAEERLRADLGRAVDGQAAAGRAVARLAAVRALALAIGGWLPLLLILAAAPWLSRRGATAGTLIGALTYVLHGLQPALRTLVQGMGSSGLRLAVTLGRLRETDAPDGDVRPLGDVPDTATTSGTSGAVEIAEVADTAGTAVELRGVTFAYGPGAEPVIRDLDLTVPYGDHLAVVGPSGIGKSTLASLVAGVLTPGAGEIRVGGRPAGDTRRRVLIPQEAHVFTGSLLDNLTYLAPGAGGAAVERAVAAIGLERLVERLGGLGARVDPAALAAGERQLIALARAYLAPMPLVILDEAGGRLDPAAEARAELAFARRPGTLIVIAHRISSALRARRVLLLDGTRAHLGRHAELLATAPRYRELVGHWDAGSQPARLLGDPDGVHPVARPDLPVDPGEVVADRPDGEHQGLGDLRG
ncbi:ABC transporter ATP-binding protein [Actinomadura viridis]|uniref:ATP-binding cassette subfamily C protein n=1 Tax=Actinomadura viridis TaxID=58110 RepID=A0A931DPB1_9ACTN|nr:ATP-binding cassette subfamily C protein [Actinomadura viridis]